MKPDSVLMRRDTRRRRLPPVYHSRLLGNNARCAQPPSSGVQCVQNIVLYCSSPVSVAEAEKRATLYHQEPPLMIVDFHTHVFPPEIIAARDRFAARDPWFAELYGNPRARMADGSDLLASMDADGVDCSVTFPFGWSDPGLIEDCNSYVIEAMRRYPGRVIGLAAAEPLGGARAVAAVERCARAGMPGIGELMPHGQGYRLSETQHFEPLA